MCVCVCVCVYMYVCWNLKKVSDCHITHLNGNTYSLAHTCTYWHAVMY